MLRNFKLENVFIEDVKSIPDPDFDPEANPEPELVPVTSPDLELGPLLRFSFGSPRIHSTAFMGLSTRYN
jgi:hypothetical protein